jgi:hypothetical protein
MHYAFAVGVVERERYLTGEIDRYFDRKLPLAPETIPQGFAADERHCVPELSGGVTGVVDRQDVGMLEPGSEFDLALEALGTECSGKLRMEDLQGNGSIVPQIVGEKYRCHPTAAELALDAVAIGEAAPELLG